LSNFYADNNDDDTVLSIHHNYYQVLAMLTVWGVADLKKLEEVRTIHTDNY